MSVHFTGEYNLTSPPPPGGKEFSSGKRIQEKKEKKREEKKKKRRRRKKWRKKGKKRGKKFHLFLISLICLVLRVGNLKNLIRSFSMNKKRVEVNNGLGPWSQVGRSQNVRKSKWVKIVSKFT